MDKDVGKISNPAQKEAIKRNIRNIKSTKNSETAKAFMASLKEAQKLATQVSASEKKHRGELRKKNERKTKKDDFEWDDEIEYILDEIDKRMEELKKITGEQE